MTTKTTETRRDDEHKEDIVTRSMFEMLCKGKPSSSLSTAHPKRRSSATTAARAGGADLSRMKQSRTGRRRRQRRNRHAQSHNNIILNTKHIICLIFCK